MAYAPVNTARLRRQRDFDRLSQIMRNIVIVLVAATYPFWDSVYGWGGAGLIVFAIAYGFLQSWRPLETTLGRPVIIIATDYIMAILLMVISGGLHSPYIAIFAYIAMSAIFILGFVSLAVIVPVQTGVFLALATVHTPTQPNNWLLVTIVLSGSLLGIGYYAGELIRLDRRERALDATVHDAILTESGRLSAFIESLMDGVAILDENGRVIHANHPLQQMIGVGTITGQDIRSVLGMGGDDAAWFTTAITDELVQSQQRTIGYTLFNKQQLQLNLSLSPAPITATSQGFVLMVRDVTKQKNLEQEHDEFVAIASHELRTPLAIAEANLSTALLPQFANTPKSRPFLDKTYRSLRELSSIVSDLAILNQSDQGQLTVAFEPVDPRQLGIDIVNEHQTLANAKGLKLALDAPTKLPRDLFTSRLYASQILENLFSNAIKYTEHGTITLGVAYTSQPTEGIIFSVNDTGIGISEADQRHLFEKFYRAENYQTRSTSGTGLGLYIAHQLASRLGGTIWFKSRLKHGSNFYVFLPYQTAKPEDNPNIVKAQASEFVAGV